MTALVVHGHFYQPPRENPWTGEIEPEPSAAPYHDWNERIHAECYAPNVNNYPQISFNFGPTLLSWLASKHPDTYQKILEADRASAAARNGHGNAIAQAYGHAILPLFFFFQAEDGIRDDLVTGVQTCALPISLYEGRFGVREAQEALEA